MNGNTPNFRWRPTNAPEASSRTDDIWFLNASVGWAVNSNGQIIRTEDGGESWLIQFQDSPPPGVLPIYFRCVGFSDAQRGWVGTTTASDRLFQTSDGGQTWTRVANLPAMAPSAICGLFVVNESVIYASGTNFPNRPARMIKTTDGGQTWTGWEMAEHASLLVDTFFTSPERGWVVGGKASVLNPTRAQVRPVVLFTEDGGQTWVNRVASIQDQLPLGEWAWKIQFLDDLVGFVSLENFTDGAILKTADGGLTWERKPVNDPQGNANLEGVGFIDAQHGWVGGWGNAAFTGGFSSMTTDGGEQWTDANEIGRFINRFRFIGNPVTVGYASGRSVYKYSAEPVGPATAAIAQAPRFMETNEVLEGAETVEITFQVPPDTRSLSIDVWSRFGEHVRRLRHESNPAPGRHSMEWDFTSNEGQPLPAGNYLYRITVDDAAESRIIRRTL